MYLFSVCVLCECDVVGHHKERKKMAVFENKTLKNLNGPKRLA